MGGFCCFPDLTFSFEVLLRQISLYFPVFNTFANSYLSETKTLLHISFMTVFKSSPAGTLPEIIGYVDPWIASPGSTIDVKVSR